MCTKSANIPFTTLTADCSAEAAETVVVGPPAPPDTDPVGLVLAYPSRAKALVGRGAACGTAIVEPNKELAAINFKRSCILGNEIQKAATTSATKAPESVLPRPLFILPKPLEEDLQLHTTLKSRNPPIPVLTIYPPSGVCQFDRVTGQFDPATYVMRAPDCFPARNNRRKIDI
jgi:hypothetical protein